MPDTLWSVLALPGLGWLVLAVAIAGVVRGFSGFGSAMIIMPVASSVLTPVGAITFLTMTELLGPLLNIRPALRVADGRDVLRLGFGAMLGLPVGIYVLSHMPADLFGWLVSLVVFALLAALIAGWRFRGLMTPRLITLTGTLGGALGGAVGLPGPPVIMLYMASTLPIATIRANLLLFLTLIDVLMIAGFAVFDLLQFEPLVAGLALTLPYMLANLAGARLFNPDKEGLFRGVAYTIIAASALIGLPLWQE